MRCPLPRSQRSTRGCGKCSPDASAASDTTSSRPPIVRPSSRSFGKRNRTCLSTSPAADRFAFALRRSRQPPSQHVHPLREMQQRRGRGQRHPRGRHHRVHGNLRAGRLERPLRMMNLEPARFAAASRRIEAVALGQKVFEGSWPRMRHGADGLVGGCELRRRR